MNDIISALEWRYATKKFDPNKKIASENIKKISEALRLSASSFGLQPWKFFIIENTQLRESLVEHSWNQRQVADASHLIVMCRRNTIDSDFVSEYVQSVYGETGAPLDALEGYKNMMLGFVGNKSQGELATWAEKQVYIALGNIMTVLASMQIDSCPMEGFIPEKYDEILSLVDHDCSSVVVLPIGYRADDDTYASRKKVRFSKEVIIQEL